MAAASSGGSGLVNPEGLPREEHKGKHKRPDLKSYQIGLKDRLQTSPFSSIVDDDDDEDAYDGETGSQQNTRIEKQLRRHRNEEVS